jgi:acetyl-CoA C-acetyltransferase
MVYPIFEHALWAKQGGSREELAARLGTMQARFADVASKNPHAWGPVGLTAEEISTATPSNRMVSLPYTKSMNANIQTDQAAAVILVSEAVADELGIARSQRIYVQGSAHATESWNFSERGDLARSPAIGKAACDALGQASTTTAHLATLDIYSCFPSAVEIACAELGVDPLTDPRAPTLTGGLAFGGGPGNGYVLQSVTATVEALRKTGGQGMVTAVGWYLTKNAVGIYGSDPPEIAYTEQITTPEVAPSRQVATGAGLGSATAEAATVIYDRDGSPALGLITALLPDGRRALRGTGDQSLLAWIDSGEPVTGKPIRLDEDEGFSLS